LNLQTDEAPGLLISCDPWQAPQAWHRRWRCVGAASRTAGVAGRHETGAHFGSLKRRGSWSPDLLRSVSWPPHLLRSVTGAASVAPTLELRRGSVTDCRSRRKTRDRRAFWIFRPTRLLVSWSFAIRLLTSSPPAIRDRRRKRGTDVGAASGQRHGSQESPENTRPGAHLNLQTDEALGLLIFCDPSPDLLTSCDPWRAPQAWHRRWRWVGAASRTAEVAGGHDASSAFESSDRRGSWSPDLLRSVSWPPHLLRSV